MRVGTILGTMLYKKFSYIAVGYFFVILYTSLWMVIGEKSNGGRGRAVRVKYRLLCCQACWVVYITV